jgi:hypothetical protein
MVAEASNSTTRVKMFVFMAGGVNIWSKQRHLNALEVPLL